MKQIKVGVIGGSRGNAVIQVCKKLNTAKVIAICDFNNEVLDRQKEQNKGESIQYFTDYDTFLKSDIDAVVLANYAHQHAPFAIKALQTGKHVFSEVLPCQNMKEAVELIEAVENSGKVYAYGENYCFMPATLQMKNLYQEGLIGELEYGEGEYLHNCETIWADITYGDKNHWRNRIMYANFYCTHSIGPLIHITGLRPVKVTGYEAKKCERNYRSGALYGQYGIEMIELENGAILKSIHGQLYKDSIWWCLHGSKGRMENARNGIGIDEGEQVYLNADSFSGAYDDALKKIFTYETKDVGHQSADEEIFNNFIKKLLGEESDIIDVYEALDMFLPGLFAYRSVLAGGKPMKIPNLRNKTERKKWKNDIKCTDCEITSGEDLLPPNSVGITEISDDVYKKMKEKYLSKINKDKTQKEDL